MLTHPVRDNPQLPPRDEQPVVMAGLGTGAAPFRAFIQERAWQRSQGKEVGPMLYYFGSRHRAQEYLYGEELEAYFQEGVVSHLGLAFSRDSDKKVYIQHKMNEDAELLAKMLEDGAFYLCGPTVRLSLFLFSFALPFPLPSITFLFCLLPLFHEYNALIARSSVARSGRSPTSTRPSSRPSPAQA
mgnify:CR=1 FL=1